MGEVAEQQLTRALREAGQGDDNAASQLLPLIYDQLKDLARQRMAMERKGHTLQATALVHEAYLRLIGEGDVPWAGRAQFFRAAADAMRRILIEHARARGRVKRGGGHRRLPLDVVDLATEVDVCEVIALDDAVTRLEKISPGVAEVVRLRFYAGLSEKETAQALGVTDRTVRREWTYARAWLFSQLTDRSY